MKWLALAALLSCTQMQAAIFPDQIGDYQKSSPNTIGIPDQALYDEYGLEATESAEYTSVEPTTADPATADSAAKRKAAKQHFSAVAWRLHDSTGALALFQFRRPPGAVRANFADLAVRASDGVIFAFGNYVFQFTGGQPEQKDMPAFYNQLTRLERSPLPAIAGYLPSGGLIANSERYILGPVSLSRFEPRIPPSVAAFHLGAEGQLGKYESPKGPLTVEIFSYPTPTMARDQATELQKIAGAIVKRTGPLVAVTIAPPDPDAAERILAKINYQASVTTDEKPPVNEVRGFARSLLNMFVLSGIILLLCVIAGVGLGGFRLLARKLWLKEDPAAMITLDLTNRPANGR